MDSNPAKRFLLEECHFDWASPLKAAVYRQYVAWCKAHGHHNLAENKFAVEVLRTYRGVEPGRESSGDDGKRPTIYRGLVLNDPFKTYAMGSSG